MFVGELRPFQVEGAEKMITAQRQLVAYDLGTGKTVMTIYVVEELLDRGEVDVGLIVCADSLKYQWLHELEKFTGGKARVIVVEGDARKRWRTYRDVLNGAAEYVIVNWNQVVNDWGMIGDIGWDYVVLDEATTIKGFTSKVSRRVKKLQPRYRYALSGQPLENRPEDIFSIMQFVDRTALGDHETFEMTFIERDRTGKIQRLRNLPLFHETMEPHWVRKRRTDPDVAKYMPKVAPEQVFTARLDPAGAKLYRRIAGDLLDELYSVRSDSFDIFAHYGESDGTGDLSFKGRVMSKLTALRMLCDHPALVRLSSERYAAELEKREKPKHGSAYAHELMLAGHLDGVDRAPKLAEFVSVVREVLDADPASKVVIFSFFLEMLQLIGEALKVGFVRFDGTMTAKQKDAAKQRFLSDPKCRVFLSSDAGGYGVNLPNAAYLYSYDLPWSAGKLKQRNARIIRLSSEFDKVFPMVMMVDGSIEERQYAMLEEKRAMASAMVDGEGFDAVDGELKLDLDTLTAFLEESMI